MRFVTHWHGTKIHVNLKPDHVNQIMRLPDHVNMICDLWTRWHDVLCVHTCKSCQHHIVSCVHDTSCWRSLVVQDHVFKSCTVDDHIVNTWWILWKHGWWVPYHLLSLSHVPHIMKVIQMWEIMSQWETWCWYTGIPALLGLGWDTSFRLPWLG